MLNGFSKNNIVNWNRLTVGAITFGFFIIFNSLCKLSPTFYEFFYLKSIFQIFRIIHDYTLGLLPIPSIYVVLPLFLYYFLNGKLTTIKSSLLAIATLLIWIINFFYLLWGFNYAQQSLYQTLDMEEVALDDSYLETETLRQTKIVESLAQENNPELSHKEYENLIRPLLENQVSDFGIPTFGRVRIRKIPAGLLLRIRTSGIYIPHALEGHIDGGLYYKQFPFTLAHEMAHGYGYTDESVCNFIAYIVCDQSDNIALKYSAHLGYWRYLARQYRTAFPEKWEAYYNKLDPILLADLANIRNHVNRYKDLMPVMKDKIYDSYLKTHGVEAGIQSYGMMIELVAAYKHRQTSSSQISQ